jgi:hypothetical protein
MSACQAVGHLACRADPDHFRAGKTRASRALSPAAYGRVNQPLRFGVGRSDQQRRAMKHGACSRPHHDLLARTQRSGHHSRRRCEPEPRCIDGRFDTRLSANTREGLGGGPASERQESEHQHDHCASNDQNPADELQPRPVSPEPPAEARHKSDRRSSTVTKVVHIPTVPARRCRPPEPAPRSGMAHGTAEA